ncbi:MAG: hypothetical protein ACRD82_13885 [Blastocatellia bacterium]
MPLAIHVILRHKELYLLHADDDTNFTHSADKNKVASRYYPMFCVSIGLILMKTTVKDASSPQDNLRKGLFGKHYVREKIIP